eukprot:g13068.t1
MISFQRSIAWGKSATALVFLFLSVAASGSDNSNRRFPAAHGGHLRHTAVAGSGTLDGDVDGKVPPARSREEIAEGATITHGTTIPDTSKETLRQVSGGQGEDEHQQEEEQVHGRRNGDGDDHPTHGAAERVSESRDEGLDALDVVAMDARQLATTSSSYSRQAELYPNCTNLAIYGDERSIGDNYCDQSFNTADCGWDGGDCCECDCGLQPLETSSLDSSTNYTCGINKYNCLDPSSACFEDLYPDCELRGGTPQFMGNAVCYWRNNIEECGYDGGDCCECDCVSNQEDRCGVANDGFDCRDPLSPVECPEPTPSPQTQAPTMSPVEITASPMAQRTASPVDMTPSVTAESDGGSDGSIAVEIVIGVVSTVVGGVALALVTKHCVGERGSS